MARKKPIHMDLPSKTDILSWRKKNGGAGWKRAAAHFGLSIDRTHAICDHIPRARAPRVPKCTNCEGLQKKLHQLQLKSQVSELVRGTRVTFLETVLHQAVIDLDNIRGQARSKTAISIQTRTVLDAREQLDDERNRILEEEGDPLDMMREDEHVDILVEGIPHLSSEVKLLLVTVLLEHYGLDPDTVLEYTPPEVIEADDLKSS